MVGFRNGVLNFGLGKERLVGKDIVTLAISLVWKENICLVPHKFSAMRVPFCATPVHVIVQPRQCHGTPNVPSRSVLFVRSHTFRPACSVMSVTFRFSAKCILEPTG